MKNRVSALSKRIVFSCICLALAGCQTLPRSGPDDRLIALGASTAHLPVDRDKIDTKYALVEITESVVSYFERTLLTSFAPGFRSSRSEPPELTVGVGDTIQVTIFESSAGGLFLPPQGSSNAGNFVELPEQTLDSSGTISVPYVGRVQAAGFSSGAIERAITDALVNKAIEPQVIVTVTDGGSSQVTVIGDVGTSQKVEIGANGERLLDVLARSGGITSPAEETYITVTRDGEKSRVLFKSIIDDPNENVYIYPQDIIFVDRERRTFVAMGATGLLGRVDFSESNLSLAEAIGEVGGLNDSAADPAQVFVFRHVSSGTLASMGVNLEGFSPGMIPTVLRINLREPSALFRAQKFAMQDGDILYVSTADSVQILKVLDFVDSLTGAADSIVSNINGTETGLNTLGE